MSALDVFDLKEIIFWFCGIVGVGSFLYLPISFIRHYLESKKESYGSLGFFKELIWVIIPFLMILFMALPAGEEIMSNYFFGGIVFSNQDLVSLFSDLNEVHGLLYNRSLGLGWRDF